MFNKKLIKELKEEIDLYKGLYKMSVRSRNRLQEKLEEGQIELANAIEKFEQIGEMYDNLDKDYNILLNTAVTEEGKHNEIVFDLTQELLAKKKSAKKNNAKIIFLEEENSYELGIKILYKGKEYHGVLEND